MGNPNHGLLKAPMGYYLTERIWTALKAFAGDEDMVDVSVTQGGTKGESSLKQGTLLGSWQGRMKWQDHCATEKAWGRQK